MKIKIENVLSCLVGLPLESAGRAANIVWFGFGDLLTIKNRKGTERKVAEFALHVQCSWRITKEKNISCF